MPMTRRLTAGRNPRTSRATGSVWVWPLSGNGVTNSRFIPVACDSLARNCMNAVETNAFVYLVDTDEPAKQVQAHELMDDVSDRSRFPLRS